ncbi:MAG: hypothetical protein IJS46_05175 [Kiritimatiellae bacterium]|nr:hypothetical protein [Kiritimatiellia bacterium]
MNTRFFAAVSALCGAAIAASALPSPSVALRFESADAIVDAATTLAAECAGPLPAMMLQGRATATLAQTGIIDPTRPIEAVAWLDFGSLAATGSDGGESGADARAALLLSLPAASENSLGTLLALAGMPSENADGGVCTNFPSIPGRTAATVRDGRLLFAFHSGDEAVKGVPDTPLALLDAAPEAFSNAFFRTDSLIEFRLDGALPKKLDDGNVFEGVDAAGFYEMLCDSLGIGDDLPRPVERLLDAAKAKREAVSRMTVDLWLSGTDGLTVSSVCDIDPASGFAKTLSDLPALDMKLLPRDTPTNAIAWALSAVETGTVASWVALDAGGHVATAAKIHGWTDEKGREFLTSTREIADLAQGVIEGLEVGGGDGEASWTASVPLASASKAAVAAAASFCDDGDVEPEEIDEAALQVSQFASRAFGATNDVAVSFADGAFGFKFGARDGAVAEGRVPGTSAAMALAGRAPDSMRLCGVTEFFASKAMKELLTRYPEVVADMPSLPAMVFAGVSCEEPVRCISFAGENRLASVASIPLADIHAAINFAQIAATMARAGSNQAMGPFVVDGTLLDGDDDDGDDDNGDGEATDND